MKANKRLGQHFLRDPAVLAEIAAIADVGRAAGALEIGPGEGALTAWLARSDKPITVLEKDERMLEPLRARFGDRVRVVHGDALREDLEALLPARAGGEGPGPVVVGNLPYNVGSAIFRRLLGLRGQVERIVVMLQREVAQRIVAEPGSRAFGVPSVATALVAHAWNVLDVPPSAFAPRPKVSSAVVLAEFRTELLVEPDEVDAVVKFASGLFQGRRKVLGNTVEAMALERVGLSSDARVESLTIEDLVALYRTLPDPTEPAI